jgi:MFS family permease
VGGVVGAWAFTRFVPVRLRRVGVGPLAFAAAVPLALCALGPGLAVTILLWGLSGAFSTACLVQAQADFVRVTPPEIRGRAIGVAASGLITAQGVAILAGGVAAEAWGTRSAVAVCGVVGIGLAAVLTGAHLRTHAVERRFTVADVARAGG